MAFIIMRRVKDQERSTWRPVAPQHFATREGSDGTGAWIEERERTGPTHLEYTVVNVPE